MLCRSCQDLIIQYYTQDVRSSAGFEFKHGTLSQLTSSARQGCEMCGLVSRCIRDTNSNYSPWVRQTLEQSTLWWSGLNVVLYEPGKFGCTDSQAALVDDIEQGVSKFYCYPLYRKDDERRFDLQRDLAARTDDDSCFNLVRVWIDCCTHGHPRCQRDSDLILPTRVIDVGLGSRSTSLVESAGKKGPYVTLSHRWGGTLPFKTTKANFGEYKREIPLARMPDTFRDAIILCRRLGIQYLWIDALCIIQDSREDWSQEAGKMASFYRNSLFTISALHAKSSYGGLFVERLVQPNAVFRSPLAGNGNPKYMGVRLGMPTFDDEMCGSSLASRGWVYQEKVLSTAILHYGATQMLWECRSRVMSESANQHGLKNEALTYHFERGIATAVHEGEPNGRRLGKRRVRI
jgi:hypothetical protein